MGISDDIAAIKRQEAALVFAGFSEADAWALGNLMRSRAGEQKLPLIIDVRIGQRQVFVAAMPGTTADNADWVRRKVNTVYRFEAASYRVGLEHTAGGKPFDLSRGIDPAHHAPAGGGFPIRVGGAVVGAVTVSGVPQREDHGFVVRCLAEFLKVPHDGIALPPESK